MKKKELMSTDVVAIEMVKETIARMFGLKIKPKSMNAELVGQYPSRLTDDWLDSMKRSLPEVDYLNAEIASRSVSWSKIAITVQASFEYGGGQLSPKFDCTILKLGSMIYPYGIALHTPNREGALRVINYEWVRSFNEPIQVGIADPADFKDTIVLS